MKKAFLFLSLIAATMLSAALPPIVQSSNEIQALLADNELQTMLPSGEVIQAIMRTETGYIVMGKRSLVRADIEYLSQSMPGPRSFRFHIYAPIELK